MTLASALTTMIFNKVLDRLLKPDVPVNTTSAPVVAREVVDEIAPIIVNQINAEPLHKSRIFRGVLIVGAGILGSVFGLTVTDGDLEQGISAVTTIVEAVGILYVLYGRLTSKGPPRI